MISGGRPGGVEARPTERYGVDGFDHILVSNNSEGYQTDWPIVNVPDDFKEAYLARNQVQPGGWQAPMNRSYALTIARENGYRYCFQLDDNIVEVSFLLNEATSRRRTWSRLAHPRSEVLKRFIDLTAVVAENTNAGIVGGAPAFWLKAHMPLLTEAFVWYAFLIDVKRCRGEYWGGFYDDMEFQMRCNRAGAPSAHICGCTIGKHFSAVDRTGNRAMYNKYNDTMNQHMRLIHGHEFSATKKLTQRANGQTAYGYRTHVLRSGLFVKDEEAIKRAYIAAMDGLVPLRSPDRGFRWSSDSDRRKQKKAKEQ